jgi:Sterol-sensing domain of SREBP cleavage-activation
MVLGAAGLCSLLGMWATLIIMEVIPFLALAVGADNMFILAHALHRQPARDAAGWVLAVLYQPPGRYV